jgi:hypothetical protein
MCCPHAGSVLPIVADFGKEDYTDPFSLMFLVDINCCYNYEIWHNIQILETQNCHWHNIKSIDWRTYHAISVHDTDEYPTDPSVK